MTRLHRAPGPGPFRDDPEDGLEEITVPRPILIAAAFLLLLAILAAGTARWTGLGEVSDDADAAIVQARDLWFEDRDDGAVMVLDRDGAVVDSLSAGTNGFARGALRALVRQRRLQGLGPERPFRLAQTADHRLLLIDPATGVEIDLRAFGPSHIATFSSLLQ
jgi:putative photosynthetic complex assembly protein